MDRPPGFLSNLTPEDPATVPVGEANEIIEYVADFFPHFPHLFRGKVAVLSLTQVSSLTMKPEANPARDRFAELFGMCCPVVSMIHAHALPGTPAYEGSVERIIEKAAKEAALYHRAGVDAIAIENMHDTPYLRGAVGPEIIAAMTAVCREVKQATSLPCGIQILAGANREALGVALAAGLDFVRVEGFVFAHIGDEGLHQSCAGDLLRYRTQIGAEHILVFADIKKKHSAHALTADVDLAETARAASFFRADGVIVTGEATGRPTEISDLEAVRSAVELPVLVGSGVSDTNAAACASAADGLIVGSHFKRDGGWDNEVDYDRVARFMEAMRRTR